MRDLKINKQINKDPIYNNQPEDETKKYFDRYYKNADVNKMTPEQLKWGAYTSFMLGEGYNDYNKKFNDALYKRNTKPVSTNLSPITVYPKKNQHNNIITQNDLIQEEPINYIENPRSNNEYLTDRHFTESLDDKYSIAKNNIDKVHPQYLEQHGNTSYNIKLNEDGKITKMPKDFKKWLKKSNYKFDPYAFKRAVEDAGYDINMSPDEYEEFKKTKQFKDYQDYVNNNNIIESKDDIVDKYLQDRGYYNGLGSREDVLKNQNTLDYLNPEDEYNKAGQDNFNPYRNVIIDNLNNTLSNKNPFKSYKAILGDDYDNYKQKLLDNINTVQGKIDYSYENPMPYMKPQILIDKGIYNDNIKQSFKNDYNKTTLRPRGSGGLYNRIDHTITLPHRGFLENDDDFLITNSDGSKAKYPTKGAPYHEGNHALNDTVGEDIIRQRIKNNKFDNITDKQGHGNEYWLSPREIQAEQYRLKLNNGLKAGEVTKEHIRNWRNNGMLTLGLQQLSDDDLLYIMNNVVDNNDYKKYSNVAKYGGIINRKLATLSKGTKYSFGGYINKIKGEEYGK